MTPATQALTTTATQTTATHALITWADDGPWTQKRFTRKGGLVEVETVYAIGLFRPHTATLCLSAARRLWSTLLADGWQRMQ